IRIVTSLPAQRECLRDRGLLKEGFFADITVLDPATMIDNATYQNPAQISQGVKYVFVNGKLEYEDGKLTGVNAGRALRGPGWTANDCYSPPRGGRFTIIICRNSSCWFFPTVFCTFPPGFLLLSPASPLETVPGE